MTWMTADAYAAVDLAQIPEYTGSPYTVINDNEPEFEADDFLRKHLRITVNLTTSEDAVWLTPIYARRLCRLRSAARLVWLSRPDGIPLNIRSLLRIDICTTYDNNMICLLSVLCCILLNENILYVCIIIDIVECRRVDVNEMVMIMIKNRKKNSKDGLLESLENYLKNFS